MDRPSAIYESEKQLKALADVLEGKEYKNTGATRGESKWLKYIAEVTEKNQIFGKKEVEKIIVPEQTLEFVGHETIESISLAQITFMVTESDIQSFIAYGNTNPELIHDVKIDGVLYKTKLQLIGGSIILGNGHIESPDMTDTGEPFLVLINFKGASEEEPTRAMFITTLGVDKHTVSISRTDIVIAKIPKEYLPDDIGGGSSVQSDWNQTDSTASDYIKNKPTISEQVQVDWNQTNIHDKSYIKNKPNVIGAKGTGLYSEIFNYPSNHLNKNTASGEASHAEGMATTASGKYSHAEGKETKAEGYQSHSEGFKTTAKGDHSHAEGSLTSATRTGAHAEGLWTIASSVYQHVQGQYNIEDTTGTYAHIVGNGTKEALRSNAHTLDWSGNAWYAGTVEGTAMIVKSSTEGSSKRFKITVDDSGVITATEITA